VPTQPEQRPRRSHRSSAIFAAVGIAATGVALGWTLWKACSHNP
jgi:hypothetical protein